MKSSAKSKHLSTIDILSIVGGVLLTIVLGLYLLGAKNYALNEVASIIVVKTWGNLLHFTWLHEGNMWLYFLLLHFWMKLGPGEFIARIPSVIFSALTIPVIFYLARELFNNRVARIMMILATLSVFFIFNAQNARSYSLLLLLTTLSSFVFIKYISNPTSKSLILYSLLTTLSIYTHLYAVLLFLAQITSLLLRRNLKVLKEVVITMFFVGLTMLPLLLSPAIKSGQINWIPVPDMRNLIGTYILFAGDFIPLAILYGGLLLFLICRVFQGLSSKKNYLHIQWQLIFTILWIVVPILGAFVFSVFVKPIYTSAYFYLCLVPFLLLIALALTSIKRSFVFHGVMVLVILLSVIRLFGWYSGNDKLMLVLSNYNDNWSEAASYLGMNAKTGEAVLYFPTYLDETLDVYYKTRPVFDEINLQPDPLAEGTTTEPFNNDLLNTIPEKYRRVWYVRNEFTDASRVGQQKDIEQMLRDSFFLTSEEHFERISIYLYEKDIK